MGHFRDVKDIAAAPGQTGRTPWGVWCDGPVQHSPLGLSCVCGADLGCCHTQAGLTASGRTAGYSLALKDMSYKR
uniref:Uncharacterized protein n=1 Tax=Knipowitschia caucasica TaxID=637954 RepID=A0AAV2KET4_KNICA